MAHFGWHGHLSSSHCYSYWPDLATSTFLNQEAALSGEWVVTQTEIRVLLPYKGESRSLGGKNPEAHNTQGHITTKRPSWNWLPSLLNLSTALENATSHPGIMCHIHLCSCFFLYWASRLKNYEMFCCCETIWQNTVLSQIEKAQPHYQE